MRRLTIWWSLASLALASAASAQDLDWEEVGATPHNLNLPDWAPDGTLWAAGRGGVYTLPAPYDSTGSWSHVNGRHANSLMLTLGQDTVVAFESTARLARTTDGGASFTQMEFDRGANGPGIAIPFGLPHGGSLVVAGSADGASGRYGGYSRDRGATWTNGTIPGHDGENPLAFALVVVPNGPRAGRVISVGYWGLAASDDGGATYAAIQPWWGVFRFGSAGAIAVLAGAAPDGGDRLVASMYDNSDPAVGSYVYLSDDGGDTWRRTVVLTGDPNSAARAAVDLGAGQALILMDGGQVWRTMDAGETWAQVGQVPGALMDPDTQNPVGRVLWAKLGPDGRLYVGGTNLGRDVEIGYGWMLRSSAPLAVAGEASPEAPEGSVSLSVQPNPSSDALTVTVDVPGAVAAARVDVVDLAGRHVASLHAGPLVAGSHTFAVDASGWAAGVYVARVAHGRRSHTARFTVTR